MLCQQVDVAGAGTVVSNLLLSQLLQGCDECLLVGMGLSRQSLQLLEHPH